MLKNHFRIFFLIVNLGILAIPIATITMVTISLVWPNEDHIQLIASHSGGTPLMVGYSSGSYSCENSKCDYSNYVKRYSYLVVPDSLNSEKFYTVSKPRTGPNVQSVSTYQQPIIMWFTVRIAMALYGCFVVRYYIKRITKQS